jgi:glutathione S-transferase
MPHWTALVSILAILFYFYTCRRVPAARRKYGVPAPAMSGNAEFERVFRVQMNTLEWMPIFLPLLWLFAFYVSDAWAAALGVIWIAARAFYMVSYTQAADKRGPGFGIQAAVCGVLLIGALVRIVGILVHGG